jgi:hypothetical protein
MGNEKAFFVVKQNDYYGVLDNSGNTVLNFVFDDIMVCEEYNLITGIRKGLTGIYTLEGRPLVTDKFDAVNYPLSYNLIPVMKGFLWGVIDRSGKFVIPDKYIEVGHLHGNNAISLKNMNHKFGAINLKGEIIIPFIYDSIHPNCSIDKGFY